MLFHRRLSKPFRCYYESSFRFTSRLGNICHSCYALLNWIIKVSLTLCIVTSCVGLSRIIIFKLQFSGQENVLVHYSPCVWFILQPRYAIPLSEKRLNSYAHCRFDRHRVKSFQILRLCDDNSRQSIRTRLLTGVVLGAKRTSRLKSNFKAHAKYGKTNISKI